MLGCDYLYCLMRIDLIVTNYQSFLVIVSNHQEWLATLPLTFLRYASTNALCGITIVVGNHQICNGISANFFEN